MSSQSPAKQSLPLSLPCTTFGHHTPLQGWRRPPDPPGSARAAGDQQPQGMRPAPARREQLWKSRENVARRKSFGIVQAGWQHRERRSCPSLWHPKWRRAAPRQKKLSTQKQISRTLRFFPFHPGLTVSTYSRGHQTFVMLHNGKRCNQTDTLHFTQKESLAELFYCT